MAYTQEQAEADRAEFLRLAAEHEAAGDPVKAGIMRAEAENCASRIGLEKRHMSSLGPHTAKNPKYCLHCGATGDTYNINDICVPIEGLQPLIEE